MYPRGAPPLVQKALGTLGTGSHRTVRDKFDALGGLLHFFLLALHLVGRVRTPALLSDGI